MRFVKLSRVLFAAAPMLFVLNVPLFAAPLKVAASSTLFADLVEKIGADRVEVKAVASPRFNAHFYEPRPSDVRSVAASGLYVSWGLDLEAWSDPLLETAGKPELFRGGARHLDLSRGVAILNAPEGKLSRSEGDIHAFGNPHYQMDPENARIMARSIAAKLADIDPPGADIYAENLHAFETALDAKIAEWRGLLGPVQGREIIAYHDDLPYFARFTGVSVEKTLEPKPGIPPTPRQLQLLTDYARHKDVRVIAVSSYQNPASAQALASRIGGKVVTICQNAGELPGTADVFGFYETNVKNLVEALK